MTTKAKAAPKRKVANSKRLPDGPDWTFELRSSATIKKSVAWQSFIVWTLTQTRLRSSPQSR